VFPVASAQFAALLLLVMTRVTAMITMLPVIGSPQVPGVVKAGFSLFVSMIALSIPGIGSTPIPEGLGPMILGAAGEAFIGLAMGFTVRLVLEAVNFAGHMAGFQMGFTIANVIDPITGDQVSIVANFQTMAATVIFIVTGLYEKTIEGVIRSFQLVGPGTVVFRSGGMEEFITLGGQLFSQAVIIGAPLIIVLLLANISMGLMSRVFPQMNVFFIGFPVTIALGLLVLAASTPFVYGAIVVFFEKSETHFWNIVKSAMPG
jgi:flagellar biosynthesis protein FliR